MNQAPWALLVEHYTHHVGEAATEEMNTNDKSTHRSTKEKKLGFDIALHARDL